MSNFSLGKNTTVHTSSIQLQMMPQTCSGWGLESLEVYLVQQCWTQPVVGIIIILDQFLFPTCLVQSFLISKLLSVFPSFFFLFCCVPQKSLHAFSLTLVSETMWHPWELQQVYWLSFPLARTECHNMRKLALKIASYSFTNSQIVHLLCLSITFYSNIQRGNLPHLWTSHVSFPGQYPFADVFL